MECTIGRFKIISDSRQFVLSEIKKSGPESKTPGEEVDSLVGYYSDFSTCLKVLPTKALMRSDATSLHEAIEVIKNYHAMIKILAMSA